MQSIRACALKAGCECCRAISSRYFSAMSGSRLKIITGTISILSSVDDILKDNRNTLTRLFYIFTVIGIGITKFINSHFFSLTERCFKKEFPLYIFLPKILYSVVPLLNSMNPRSPEISFNQD